MKPTFEQLKETFLKSLWNIRTEDRWCQGSYAVNSNGSPTDPNCTQACKFCSVGTIFKAVAEIDNGVGSIYFTNQFSEYTVKRYGVVLHKYNDCNNYADVIRLWLAFGKSQDYIAEDFTIDQLTQPE